MNSRKGLSGFTLKWIAIVSMIIDHFGSIVMDGILEPYKKDGMIYFTDDMPFLIKNSMLIKEICDILGSIAFPIFCFLIVEGFLHTRNRVKYGILLGVFALISEIPYDIAHYQKLLCFSLQNVMFTLCIGLFSLYLISLIEKKWENRMAIRIILMILVTVTGAGLAFLIRSEYVFLGIITIILLYLFRNRKWQLVGLAPLLIASPWIVLAAIILYFYNGKRGKGSKYFFYIFYPTHFLIFAGISWMLVNR